MGSQYHGPAWKQVFMKALNNFALQTALKINQHIAAKDKVKFVVKGQVALYQVVFYKLYFLRKIRPDFQKVLVGVRRKIAVEIWHRFALKTCFEVFAVFVCIEIVKILTLFGLFQGFFADVGGVYFGPVEQLQMVQQNQKRIDFLTR